LSDKAFENVKNQIGYCGIWCGSCIVGNGTLRELTRRYEELIKLYDLEDWAPKDFNFKEFKMGLTSLQNIPHCQGCLKDGGRTNCEMRECASAKNLSDCSECEESMECLHHEILQIMQTGANRAGLFVKTENIDRNGLLEKWNVDIKRKWPICILLLK